MSKILLIGLILCGCGGGVTRPGGPSGTLKQEQVSALVSDEVKALLEVSGPQNLDATKSSALEVALSTAATTIESGLASDLRSQDSADLCQVQLIGTNTDADNDGIEVSLTKSFSCDVNQNGSSLSVSGKSALSDKDDASDYGGYKIEFANVQYKTKSGDSEASVQAKGTLELTKNSATFNGVYNIELTELGSLSGVWGVSGAAGSLTDTSTIGIYVDSNLSPTTALADTNPSSSGTWSSISGYLKVSRPNLDVTLTVQGSNLTYSSGCNQASGFIENGDLTLTDGSNNVVKLSHANCTATTTFNGTAITN
jgi:hypothetical protein